jgi:DNA processing protein
VLVINVPPDLFAGMDDEELYFTIALTMVQEVGPVLSKNLLAYAGSAKKVFDLPRVKLERVPGVGSLIAEKVLNFKDFKRAERQLEYIKREGSRILRFNDSDYPQRLNYAHDAPLLLYYRGNANLNCSHAISIVGTRLSSEEGRQFAEDFVAQLVGLDCLVVSGLAYGIDIHAHRSCIKHKIPTIGVVAHGLDTLYPSRHLKVVEEMLECGGVLTEYPIETVPDRENFPSRNRIVAGMCDATIVVETPIKGGAMITANLAHSYNREVFSVPGRVGDPKKEGNHYLIKKNKAALIESVDDLLEYMGWEKGQSAKGTQFQLELTPKENTLMLLFDEREKWPIDELNHHASSSDLSLNLLELEMKGLIRCLPGKVYQRVLKR